MRTFVLAACMLSVGCAPDTPTAPSVEFAGTYALTAVNGVEMPTPFAGSDTYRRYEAGVLEVGRDGAMRQAVMVSLVQGGLMRASTSGACEGSGYAIRCDANGVHWTGTLSANGVEVVVSGNRYAWTRTFR